VSAGQRASIAFNVIHNLSQSSYIKRYYRYKAEVYTAEVVVLVLVGVKVDIDLCSSSTLRDRPTKIDRIFSTGG